MHRGTVQALLLLILLAFFGVLALLVDWAPTAQLGPGRGASAAGPREAARAGQQALVRAHGIVLLPPEQRRLREQPIGVVVLRGAAAAGAERVGREAEGADRGSKLADSEGARVDGLGYFDLRGAVAPGAGKASLGFLPGWPVGGPGGAGQLPRQRRELLLEPGQPRFVVLDLREPRAPLLRVRLAWQGMPSVPVEVELEGGEPLPAPLPRMLAADFELPAKRHRRARLRVAAELGGAVVLHLARDFEFGTRDQELRLALEILPLRIELGEEGQGLWLLEQRSDAVQLQVELGAPSQEALRVPAGSFRLGRYQTVAANEPPIFRELLRFEHRSPGTRIWRLPSGALRAEARK